MSSDEGAGDRWDFYPCDIDDVPASILLNFKFVDDAPPVIATTLYRMRIQMLEPGDHGMGTAAEHDAMSALEEQLEARVGEAQLWYVARIRSGGIWELVFYGPPERNAALQGMRETIRDRRTYLDVRPDPDWGYYREFLLPDDERSQWMADRQLVDLLSDRGDALTTARPVEHLLYFETTKLRDRFAVAAVRHGFTVSETHEADGERPFAVLVTREDAVELGHIHDVVMQLVELAAPHGGEYDGWETPLVIELKPPAN